MVAPVDGRGQGAADGLKEKSMGWLEKLRMRLRALRHGEEVHGEIAEEWQFHIDLRTEESWKLSGRTCDSELGSCGEALDSHLWRCSRWDWGLEATRLSSV